MISKYIVLNDYTVWLGYNGEYVDDYKDAKIHDEKNYESIRRELRDWNIKNIDTIKIHILPDIEALVNL